MGVRENNHAMDIKIFCEKRISEAPFSDTHKISH